MYLEYFQGYYNNYSKSSGARLIKTNAKNFIQKCSECRQVVGVNVEAQLQSDF